MAEIALRWVSHHGLMRREYGDAILIGASSTKHIEQVSRMFLETNPYFAKLNLFSQNMIDLEKGPLRAFNFCVTGANELTFYYLTAEAVIKALDKAWILVKPYASNYYRAI
jgi:aflatoxin B1 aldehyde reductase